MRRFISYIALTSALILGAGLATVPTIMNMDGDLGYADGSTLYFRAATYDEASENGNYASTDGGKYTFIDNSLYVADASAKTPIEYIADTMRTRLDAWGVSGYKVETQGDSTVAVSLRASNNSDTMMTYIEKILTFNGGDFSFDATDNSYDDYAYNEKWSSLIDGQTARIEDIDMQGYKVPVVVVPLQSGDEYKTAFKDLINYCVNHTTIPAEDDKETQPVYTNIVVWSNRSTLAPESYKDATQNKNIGEKIIMIQNASNDNAVWYDASDTKKENPSLQLIPGSKATSGGTYDPTYTQEAYDAARYVLTLMNSGSYEYDVFKNSAGGSKFAVTYLYSETAPAAVENLITKDYNKTAAMSKTLISVLVTVAFICLILALFERMMSLIQIASLLVTGFATFATFVAFGAQFNIAALIGLGAAAMIALFGSLFYTSRLRDEIYKGRTLKKAHTEASKRSTWPILDAGIISAILGVFLYVLGGDIASKAGVMLVLGGLYGTIFNLVVTRLAGWIFCHDSTMASAYPKYIHVDTNKIPDLLKEEKQSYFGPYENRDFTKGKKVGALIASIFLLAGIGGMIGFGVANNGNFFNTAAYNQANTVLQIEVKSEKSDVITLERMSSISYIYDSANEANHDAILNNYKVNGTLLSKMVKEVNLSQTNHEVVTGDDVDDLAHEYWFYYNVSLNTALDNAKSDYEILVWDGTNFVNSGYTELSDLAVEIIDMVPGGTTDNLVVSFANVKPQELTPYFYQVALGLGVGLAVALVYAIIRYRPSRGLSLVLLTSSTAFTSVAFYALTRISTTPVVSLGAVLVIITMLLGSLFILAGEKEIYKDYREKDKDTYENRTLFLSQATSRQAGTVILFILMAAYMCIMAFAFGPSQYASPYIAAILGVALTALCLLTLLQPSSAFYAKGFSKITFRPSLPKRKKANKPSANGGNLMKRKKGAEPEEAIFIGIND